MREIKKSSKSDLPLVFLKWLVTILSLVMIFGFLFLVTILGIKISNFNTTSQNLSESPNREILIPDGIIETIDIDNETLTVVVKVNADHLEIVVMDLKDGIILNQYSVKQKKSLYNERK
ncbi:DUF6476 family protein [Paracoccaceae bacterium]|nr:DUF6476 family protein [Paracoccaceae bacterium]